MNKYSFSILIPAYKAQFLKDAIESVLAQTYDNFELVIVNDASPEDLTSIVSQFSDPRIKYSINEKNCGAKDVVDNWNICLSKATGDFVICMGDDDRLMPNCLQTYSDLIDKYPNLDVYHGWSQIIDENNAIIDLQEPRPEYENILFLMYHNLFKLRRQFIGDYLFRKSHLIDNDGFFKTDYAWCADDLTCFRAVGQKGIANTQEYVFQYRCNSLTISENVTIETKWKTRHEKINWCLNYLNWITPNSDLDLFFKTYIKNNIGFVELRSELLDIQNDISQNGLKRSIFWLKNKYNLPFHSLVNNVLLGIRERLRLKIFK